MTEHKDILPGGMADKKQPKDFDQKALRKGKKVESEHTSSRSVAEEITMDHLSEDPRYYDKLEKMEKKASISAFFDELEKIAGVGQVLLSTPGRMALGGAIGAASGLATGEIGRLLSGTKLSDKEKAKARKAFALWGAAMGVSVGSPSVMEFVRGKPMSIRHVAGIAAALPPAGAAMILGALKIDSMRENPSFVQKRKKD